MPRLDTPPPAPYDPFVPRRGRTVALVAGTLALLLFCVLALLMPGGPRGYGFMDRLLFVAVGGAIAGLLARYAAIRAVPDEDGLTVRNLMLTRHVRWEEVEQVRFGHGDPWPHLLLHDTEQVAVMAIQRADGVGCQAEAGRLAALVQAHARGEGPDGRRGLDEPLH